MNDNAKKWVAALHSGQFKQTKSCLSSEGRYCCLGVACEVYIADGHVLEKSKEEGLCKYGGERYVLPPIVQHWLRLRNDNGSTNAALVRSDGGFSYGLSSANDRGATFTEIADFIESEPDGLFVK